MQLQLDHMLSSNQEDEHWTFNKSNGEELQKLEEERKRDWSWNKRIPALFSCCITVWWSHPN